MQGFSLFYMDERICIFEEMKYTIILLLFSCALLGQSYKTDTIDYSVFTSQKEYSLAKITEGKFENAILLKENRGRLAFFVIENNDQLHGYNHPNPWHISYNVNDTILTANWDQEDKIAYYTFDDHNMGKTSLNSKTNLLIFEKWGGGIKPIIRKFKILKWTKTEIILLDFSNIKLNRKYYFHK